jgi:hypothetical protein
MGVKQILAERTRRKLRFAVLRPKNQALIPTAEEMKEWEGMPAQQFQQVMNDSLRDGAIFVGFLKHKCRTLFDGAGYPTGGALQPGDVLDKIEDFEAACKNGAYQLEARDQNIMDGRRPE